MPTAIRQVLNVPDIVGESIVWDIERECLFWVDIIGKGIRRLHPASGDFKSWEVAEFPTSIGLRTDGGAIVGLTHRVALWNFDDRFETLAVPEPNEPGNRLNEGRVAPDGSFWVGTMATNFDADGAPIPQSGASGRYHRVDAAGHTACLSDIRHGIPNGMVWLPDGRFVTADTVANAIFCFDVGADGKALINRRRFAEPLARGLPDGACLDEAGGTWTCRVGGGYAVTRTMPDGKVDRTIELPCAWPTSCTFGGPGLKTLYITSARFTMTAAHLSSNMQEGALFACEPGVAGVPENRFKI